MAFSALTLVIGVFLRKKGWNDSFSKATFWCATASLTLFVTGFVASVIGDKIHGSGNSFDWSPVYVITLPMMIVGWCLSVLNFTLAIIALVTKFVKRGRSDKKLVH